MQTSEQPDAEADASGRTPARWVGLRSRARPWLVTVLVLAVLATVIGLAGGWRPATADTGRGRALPAGKEIRLARWKITVLDAELSNVDPDGGYQTPDTIRLRFALENRGDKTSNEFPITVLGQDPDATPGVLTIDPQTPERPDSVSDGGALGQLGVDPQITQPWTVEIAYQQGITVTAPTRIAVVVRDEKKTKSLASSSPDDFEVADAPVGHLLVPLVDRRTR
ncbi:hypothetical protein B0O41_3060 [Propionibacteriaceae bacterium ES.041]|uniref:hypothetical protein n=1 Tax=Enemella evansiae TaxID=2016499 RepID=UPI000B968D97|nr:hypothetical protein [Enemella evansiae]OYO01026.1 hypothetical protein CGZ96_04040 [Enemella evansiae]PFG68227.1 hypothetical protein B0O41_3060 [Propionibacteriaceae bacterium ES.041]